MGGHTRLHAVRLQVLQRRAGAVQPMQAFEFDIPGGESTQTLDCICDTWGFTIEEPYPKAGRDLRSDEGFAE